MKKTSSKKTGALLCGIALTAAATLMPRGAYATSEPYIGEIMATGISSFCPRGWYPAEGQLLPIASNDALFSLLGTTYGGDGRTSFGLPDLRGRTPRGAGSGPGLSNVNWGERHGTETVILNQTHLAPHSHEVNANNLDGDKPGPGGKILAAAPPGGTGAETIYSVEPPNVQMSPQMISTEGLGQPMDVLDPTSVVRYCISNTGYYPPRS